MHPIINRQNLPDLSQRRLEIERKFNPTTVVSRSLNTITATAASQVSVIVECLHDTTENVFMIYPDTTVVNLKWAIYGRKDIAPDNIQLTFLAKVLEDDKLLVDYGITDCSTVCLTQHQRGGAVQTILLLDENLLDPQYDRDFTNIRDSRAYERGGYPYKRPYGWKKIALKVKGKYEDDVWLGELGPRRHSSPGEWAVSYHGVSKLRVKGIASRGHYSTPDIEVAKGYALKFEFKGKMYLMVLQNRVNLTNSKIISKELTEAGAEYFVTPSRDSIRLYALCIKEC